MSDIYEQKKKDKEKEKGKKMTKFGYFVFELIDEA